MSEHVEFPDVLASITGGVRKHFDYVQCAVSTKPDVVNAGDQFEAILLIQSVVNEEIDVRVELELPKKDIKNNKGTFGSASSRLLVGLQPAEVGFVSLPLSVAPHTAPANDYEIGIKISVKRYRGSTGLLGRAQEIRARSGGARYEYSPSSSAPAMQEHYEALSELSFSSEDKLKRGMIYDTFTVNPAQGLVSLSSVKQQKAGWVSLWTMADHMDTQNLVAKVSDEWNKLIPVLRREKLFKPLLQKVQEMFKSGNYPLHTAEAIYITKVMTLVVELGAAELTDGNVPEELPRWVTSASRLLMEDSRYADQPAFLITKRLFNEVLLDTIMHSFTMVSTVMKEDFGTEEEFIAYAYEISDEIGAGGNLSFGQAYFPLICAGVIANNRVTLPGEQVRDTLNLLFRTLEERVPEKNADNEFVFETVIALIDRGLENF